MNQPGPASGESLDPAAGAFAATLAGASTSDPGEVAAGKERRLRPAHRVGRYLILRQIGAGGMGVVFAAYDEELDRKVAVKLLREAGDAHSDRRTRILREAQAMARISHPNVVQIYEVGELAAVSGQVFIAMEFIEGTTLSDWQRERSWEEVLPIYLAAGQGLIAAHESGLVHRDFKPDNVLLGSDGRPRVADFGLARTESSDAVPPIPQSQEPGSAVSSGSLLVSPLTQAGAILGTPAYMSAEQHRGEPTDSRCDQFSFCAALYEGLYKTLPFAGLTLGELRDNVLAGNLRPPPAQTTVPRKLYAALRRGLAADPEQRFPSMRELLEALAFDPERDPAASPGARRFFSRALMGIMLVVLVALLPATRSGQVTPAQGLGAAGVFLVVGIGAAYFLRRTLLRNEFHRGTMFLMLVFSVEQIGMRGVAALIGLTSSQVLPLELVCMAGIAASLAYFFFKAGWLVPPLLLLSALWGALRPDDAGTVAVVAYPAAMMIMVGLWERAARARELEEFHQRLSCYTPWSSADKRASGERSGSAQTTRSFSERRAGRGKSSGSRSATGSGAATDANR